MPFEGGDINGVGTDEVRCAPDFVAFQNGKSLPQPRGARPNQGGLHLTKDLDQRKARVSKQVKSRFSRRRRRSPPDSSGLPGARAPE